MTLTFSLPVLGALGSILCGVVVCLDSESKECFPGAHPNSSFVFGDKCYWVSIPQTTANLQVGLHPYQTYEFGKEGQWLKVPRPGQTWQDPHQLKWEYFHKISNGDITRTYCRTLGGKVAMPKTKAINDFLVDVLVNKMAVDADEDLFYIGFNNWDDNLNYLWDDCTPPSYTNVADRADLSKIDLYCFALDPLNDGVWRGFRCANSMGLTKFHNYICEFQLEVPPQKTTPPPTTTTVQVQTTEDSVCPIFECDLDCDLFGYILDSNGCNMCKCDNDN